MGPEERAERNKSVDEFKPTVLKDSRGRLYDVSSSGTRRRRHSQTALSKRDRAKLKRRAKRNPPPVRGAAIVSVSSANVV